MRYGFVHVAGGAALAADLAKEAERAGWDGFFCWEGIWAVDAWVSLAAAAMRTSTIRLGTMLTPLPRRKPWELASQAATLDNLSGGRVILSVGLGAGEDRFFIFEDDPGRKVRAEMLDEGLEMLTLLWREEAFSFTGKHYRARPATMMIPPAPAQRPRIPIWVVGLWPARRSTRRRTHLRGGGVSMARSARWDGWLPHFKTSGDALNRPPREQLAEGVAWLRAERERLGLGMDGYDVVMEGNTSPGEEAVAEVKAWADAGATWWLEANWSLEGDKAGVEKSTARLRAGPPRGQA